MFGEVKPVANLLVNVGSCLMIPQTLTEAEGAGRGVFKVKNKGKLMILGSAPDRGFRSKLPEESMPCNRERKIYFV
jgi:hypothetical protein